MQFRFALGVVLDKGYQHSNFHRSNDTGRVREVTTCISYRAKLTPEALRALASGAFLSCSGKKGRKVVRLKGGATRSRSNCSPLENPPGGTIGRLTLRFGSGAGFQPLPPL